MFKDNELDNLARERDRISDLLKAARDERKRCGQVCTRLHNELDAAHRTQQRIYESNQAAWEQHQSFMRDCSQKIEFWRAESDRCHTRMTDAFAQSQSCWSTGDRAGAKSWSEAGKRHQGEMRNAKEQAAEWISHSKDSQYRFKTGQSDEMDTAKARTRQLKAEFENANTKLKAAKVDVERLEKQLESARARFNSRLNWLKMEAPQEHERRLQAEAALKGQRLAEAMQLYRERYYAEPGRHTQGPTGDEAITTRVKSGWSRRYEMPCTDVLIFCRGVNGHHHIVIGENGQVFINKWRDK